MTTARLGGAVIALALLSPPAHGADLTLDRRLEYTHVSRGHELHVSGAAVAAGGDGAPPVRVNPDGLVVEALHHAPRLIQAPGGGPLYVSWSSEKSKPEGTLFASDLRLSRSLDGGKTFEAPLRVNDDRQ